jgi:hypothetical protein
MREGFLRRCVAPVVIVALTAASVPVAVAQTDEERAGARAAADAGLKAYDAKKWSECVDLFTRAESLVHAPPHLLYVARCSAQLGKLVKARETYLKMKNETIPADKPKAFHDAKSTAITELAAIEPRLAYVNISVENAQGKTVSVMMDGTAVPPALLGIPKPADPGEHKLQATAEGMSSPVATITLKEGQTENVKLELAAGGTTANTGTGTTPPPAGSSTATAPTTTATETPTSTPPPADTPSGGSGTKTIGYVVAGVGVVSLLAGGFFFLRASSKSKEGDELFTKYNCKVLCTPSQQAEVKDADSASKSATTLGFVFAGVGVAAVGAGVYLMLSGGDSKTASHRVQPLIGLGVFGLQGSF